MGDPKICIWTVTGKRNTGVQGAIHVAEGQSDRDKGSTRQGLGLSSSLSGALLANFCLTCNPRIGLRDWHCVGGTLAAAPSPTHGLALVSTAVTIGSLIFIINITDIVTIFGNCSVQYSVQHSSGKFPIIQLDCVVFQSICSSNRWLLQVPPLLLLSSSLASPPP